MRSRGLKTNIAVSITVFLLVGMLSIDIVTLLTAQRNAVRGEVAKGKAMAHILRVALAADRTADESGLSGASIRWGAMLQNAGIDCFFMLTRTLDHIGFGTPACTENDEIVQQAQKALFSGNELVYFAGSTFGVIWYQPERVIVSAPAAGSEDPGMGAFSLVLPLTPVFRALRQTHHMLLLYIVINTGVLSFLGIYRVAKLYLQPLSRLAQRAEDYKEDDELLFSVRKEDNELLRLSSALNNMMRRLAAEKSRLRETVCSLETANAELKRAQEDMVRAEKLASVGRLSAGIAHEIGNPLGIVTGYLSLLRQEDLLPSERREYLERSESELERINAIIRQLLDISRPAPGGVRPVSVHRMIGDLQQMLALQPFMSQVRVATQTAAAADTVAVDPDRLRQVFLNLAINAADAIAAREGRPGGRLKITTASAGSPVSGYGDGGGWLQVRFVDDGAGIHPESLPFIFDPFYTTKGPGKGTGLGLSVSFMIIQAFGGVLEAESTVGVGTTMTIRLPLLARDVALAHSPTPAERPSAVRPGCPELPLEAAR